jgi:hypothetical protein
MIRGGEPKDPRCSAEPPEPVVWPVSHGAAVCPQDHMSPSTGEQVFNNKTRRFVSSSRHVLERASWKAEEDSDVVEQVDFGGW